MNNKKSSGILAALSIAVLLILTAWANAWAMLIVSAVMLGLSAALLRGKLLRGAAPVSAVGVMLAPTAHIETTFRIERP